MGLIERRIGLLFAVFLSCSSSPAAGRAGSAWCARDTLKAAAATQQKADIVVPARRGTITDVHGTELAVSRPAVTITATPYLVKDPAEAARRLAPALGMPEDDILKKLARRDTGFVYVARKVPLSRAERAQKLGIAGPRVHRRSTAATTRATGWRRSCWATSAPTATASPGSSTGSTPTCAARTASASSSRTRSATRSSCADVKRTEPGKDVRLTLDAAIQDQHRGGARPRSARRGGPRARPRSS